MIASLDQARLVAVAGGQGLLDWNGADRAYAAAFVAYGLDVLTLNREEAVRRIQESAIRRQLVSALDYWAFVRSQLLNPSGTALQTLAQEADDDPWRPGSGTLC